MSTHAFHGVFTSFCHVGVFSGFSDPVVPPLEGWGSFLTFIPPPPLEDGVSGWDGGVLAESQQKLLVGSLLAKTMTLQRVEQTTQFLWEGYTNGLTKGISSISPYMQASVCSLITYAKRFPNAAKRPKDNQCH